MRKSATKTTATVTKTPAAGGKTSTAASNKRSSPAIPATSTKTKAGKPKTASAQSPMPTRRPQLTAWLKDPSRTGSELAAAAGKSPETDRLIAAHTAALPKTLSTLSHSSDKATRSKVAANANTPPTDYLRLGQQFPNEFLANPVIDLLLLENPGLLGELPEALLLRVLKREACPADFLVWAAGLPAEKVQLAVAMNPKAPAGALERLRQSKHAKVRESVSAASSELEGDPEVLFREAVKERLAALTPEEAKEAWQKKYIGLPQLPELTLAARLEIADAHDQALPIVEVAKNPNLPVHLLTMLAQFGVYPNSIAESPKPADIELDALARDSDEPGRKSVARNPNTPVALLEALAKDEDWGVRRAVAKNPNTPVALLEALAKDKDSDVRRSVAWNPNTPVAVLEALAKDTGWSVRSSVAKNPNTPAALLVALAKDRWLSVRAAVAGNPNTPVALIAALAKDKEWSVRRSVAENPNTPVASLELTAESFISVAKQLQTNPLTTPKFAKLLADAPVDQQAGIAAGDFLVFVGEDPNKTVLSKHLLGTVFALCAGPFVEPSRIARVSGSAEWLVRAAVARNIGTTPNILKKFSADAHPVVRALAAANVAAHKDLSAALTVEPDTKISFNSFRIASELKTFFNVNKIRELARNPNASTSLLDALSPDDDPWVREAVAGNPNVSHGARNAFALDVDPLVRIALAGNPTASSDLCRTLLEPLVKCTDESVRTAVASNPSTPTMLLNALAEDTSEKVRKVVAKNPNTPAALLALLAKDKEWGVRCSVAENPNTPVDLLESLVQDDWGAAAVAENPNAPEGMLKTLAELRSSWVREAVSINPSTPVELLEVLAKDEDSGVRRYVAKNSNTPVALLDLLAKDEDSDVRCSVAENPNTPATSLELLTRDKYVGIQRSMVRNPNAPAALLRALAQDNDHSIRRAVACNPNTPVDLLESLVQDYWRADDVASNPNAPEGMLKTLAEHWSSRVRKAVSINPSTPVQLLEVLANDEEEDVRRSVAENPNTPVAMVQALREEETRLLDEALVLLRPNGTPALPEALILRWMERLTDFPSTPDNKALTKASRNKNWLIRLGVALHPQASDAMLELLMADTDVDVAAAARKKLAERRS